MARVLVPLPEGFEEIEAVTVVDLLRRAGVEVRTASLAGRQVTGSHGIRIEADITLDDADVADYDMIVLPGGMPGADHLKNDARVIETAATICVCGPVHGSDLRGAGSARARGPARGSCRDELSRVPATGLGARPAAHRRSGRGRRHGDHVPWAGHRD